MKVFEFPDGYVVNGDCTEDDVQEFVIEKCGRLVLVIADPPYGNIVVDGWDRVDVDDKKYAAWMMSWTRAWAAFCKKGAAFYVWGGAGRPGFRPFFRYIVDVESVGAFELATPITWAKKRAYGVQNNYLWTREELAYFVVGDAKKPRCFNVPYLAEKRGYAGYNAKYPAKSEFFRRTNVWSDITEVLRGKVHTAQKAQRLHEVMIEVHTSPGDWVVDLFAGSGVTAFAARALGRRFVVIEKDAATVDGIVSRL